MYNVPQYPAIARYSITLGSFVQDIVFLLPGRAGVYVHSRFLVL